MDIASYLKRPPVPAVLVGIASYLKRLPVPAVLAGIASYLKRLPVPAVLAGNAPYLKRLPVPAVLAGALYAGYTGNIPFVGGSMDALFTEIDVSIFEVVMYPVIFMFFSGRGGDDLKVIWEMSVETVSRRVGTLIEFANPTKFQDIRYFLYSPKC